LLLAAQNGHLDIVRFLVEAGAAIDQGNNNGSTPLWLAAQDGHLDIVRFLVEAGAATERICHHLLRHNLVRLQQKNKLRRVAVSSLAGQTVVGFF